MPLPPAALTRSAVGRLLLAAACLLAAGRARAVLPLIDDWSDRFAVGAWTRARAVPLRDGWPEGLWCRPRWQPDRRQALAALATLEPERPDSLAAWRLSGEAAIAWQARAASGDTTVPPPLANLPRHEVAAETWSLLAAGPAAASACRRITDLLAGDRGVLPPHERFAWELRLAAARQVRGDAPDWTRLWRSLLGLPAPDRAAGWAVWSAIRRERGLGVFPADTLTVAESQWLASLPAGSVPWRSLDALHLPPDVKAGLGAALLRGNALRRHLGMYPRLPGDPAWQRPWLLARWRQRGSTAAAARELASLPGVAPHHAAELLRRSVDRRLSRDDRDGVVADLSRASQLVDAREGRTRRLVRAEVERALTLARHRGWDSLARRLAALVHWQVEPRWPSRLAAAAASVDAGEAPDCGDRALLAGAPTGETAWRLALWREWGRRLLAAGKAGPLRDRLSRLLAARPERPADLLPRLASLLADGSLDLLRDAVLEHDIVRVAGGRLPRPRSALLAAVRDCPDSPRGLVDRFVLLGAAVVLDDPAAQLAAAVGLPAAGLPADHLLVLRYPVPAQGSLRAALAGTDLDPALLLALARNESAFRPTARSASGALGWLQVMPFHHAGGGVGEMGPAWTDPVAAVSLASRLLMDACRRHGGDPYRVVAAYNAGDRAVARWRRQLGGRPGRSVFAAWIGYPETRRYTRQVLIDRQVYRWLLSTRRTVAEPASRSTPRT